MRRFRIVQLAASSLLALTASSVLRAQDKPSHPIQFLVNGGATVPAGDLSDHTDLGFHVAGSMLFRFGGLPSLRPEVSLTRLKQKAADLGLAAHSTRAAEGDSLETTQLLGLMGNIELPLFVGLYAIAGVGAMSLDNSIDSQTKVAFNAGAGWRFQIGRIGGFVEARFGSASYDGTTFGYTSAQFIPVSFGLIF